MCPMTFQRARSEEQREIRRRTILDTAAAMLDEMPVAEVSLNELSRRVGLAKSNVLRYFESREAVLLELLEHYLQGWLAELSDELATGVDPSRPAPARGDQLAAVLGSSLARHTVLCDLIGTQTGVLEHNVSVEVVVRHKRAALDGLATMAELLHQHVPELGAGARTACLMIMIMAGSLPTYCRPSASVLAAYEADPSLAADPVLAEFHLDLRGSLETAIATLIAGTLARAQ